MNTSTKRRAGAVAGLAAVSAVALSSMGAGGAAAGALPGGFTTQTLADGTKVSVQLKDEFVTIARSGAANATTRNAWVSGKVIVTVNGANASGGDVNAGYLVGCQVDFSGGGNVGGSATPFALDAGNFDPSTAGGGASGGVTLAPGVAKFIPVIDSGLGKYNGSDSADTSFSFKGNRGGIAYSQETFQVNGCAGYASAKAAIQVKVSTDAVDGYVTLYGKPFSIG